MTKLLLASFILVAFSGCTSGMTGTEMRTAINECEDNNLTYEAFRDGLTYKIVTITCVPPTPHLTKDTK